MLLEKPAFSPVLNYKSAENKVSHLLKSKNWGSFSFKNSSDLSRGKLFYAPFYFFSYVIHSEAGGKTKIHSSGFNALNLFSNKFEKHVSNVWHMDTAVKMNQIDDESATVLRPRISEEEAKRTIPIYVAASNNTSKDTVIVSGFETYYIPIFVVDVVVDGKTLSFRVNAIDGHIINNALISAKEKGFSEIMDELFQDLTTPKGWADNLSSVLSSSAPNVPVPKPKTPAPSSTNSPGFFSNLSRDDIIVLVIAALAILIILVLAY